MYAVISSGGKQYRLSEGDFIDLERLDGKAGDQVVFDQVLFLGDGEEPVIGTPTVEGARVVGTIVEQGKGDKIVVFKFKRRKMYRRRTGHRQLLTRVKVDSIETGGKLTPKAKAATALVEEKKAETAKKKPAAKKKEAASKKEKKAAKKESSKKASAKKPAKAAASSSKSTKAGAEKKASSAKGESKKAGATAKATKSNTPEKAE